MDNDTSPSSDQEKAPEQSQAGGLGKFWQELKRRQVVKVGVAYAVVAWLLIQVAATLLPAFGAPKWVEPVFFTFVFIGFPLAIVLAWVYEMTPQGVKATSELESVETATRATSQRLNYVIVGFLVLAVAFLIVDLYILDKLPRSQTVNPGNLSSPSNDSSSGGIKRFTIGLEEGRELALADMAPLGVGRRSITISPDGSHLAYVVNVEGTPKLFLKPMDEFKAQPLEGTEGACGPFFSPDGQWIGFLTKGKVMKVSIRGGTPQTLAEAGNVYGADWGPDNTIVFVEQDSKTLSVISADGGNKQTLFSGAIQHPEFLPDGKAILLANTDKQPASVILYLLETGETIQVIERGSAPHFIPTGHIVYTTDSGISAIKFNPRTYKVSGPSVPVLKNVRREYKGPSQLTFSMDGWLAYIPGGDMEITSPVWVDRTGVEESIPLPLQRYGTFRLSHDSSQVALIINDPEPDVWLYRFKRDTSARRLTTGGNKSGTNWSLDGNTVAFGITNFSGKNIKGGIFQQRVAGSQVLPMMQNDNAFSIPDSWRNEKLLFYTVVIDSSQSSDIWVAQLDSKEEPEPFVATSANEWGASTSPDGRFVAYTSDDSGQYQIYVKEYPPSENRWMISAGYGEEPIWSAQGDEIFYRRGNQWLSVPVKTDPHFEADTPHILFEGPYVNVWELSYDVTADAQHFFLLKQPDQPPANKIHVVANWFDELNRLVPTNP